MHYQLASKKYVPLCTASPFYINRLYFYIDHVKWDNIYCNVSRCVSLMGAMRKEIYPLVTSNSLYRHSKFIIKKLHN